MDLYGQGKKESSQIAIIEPLAIIFINWQLARTLGSQSRSQIILEAYQQTHLTNNNFLGEIIGRSSRETSRTIHLLTAKDLSLLGEKRTIDLSGREWQFIIGLPNEVSQYLHDKKIYDEAVAAMQKGILPLIILESANKGGSPKYGYVGTLLFEPHKNEKADVGGQVRFVSVLPAPFLGYYYENRSEFSAIATEAADLLALNPKEIEDGIQQFSIIGSANFRDRYQILTLLTAINVQYQFLSRNPTDSQLTSRFGG